MNLLGRIHYVLGTVRKKPKTESAWLVGVTVLAAALVLIGVGVFRHFPRHKAIAQDHDDSRAVEGEGERRLAEREGQRRFAEGEAGPRRLAGGEGPRSPEAEGRRRRSDERESAPGLKGFRPETPREEALLRIIRKLHRELAQLPREVRAHGKEGGEVARREGDRREGDLRPDRGRREGFREGDSGTGRYASRLFKGYDTAMNTLTVSFRAGEGQAGPSEKVFAVGKDAEIIVDGRKGTLAQLGKECSLRIWPQKGTRDQILTLQELSEPGYLLRSKAAAENNPLICAILIATKIPNHEEKTRALFIVIDWVNDLYSEENNGKALNNNQVDQVLSVILDTAQELKGGEAKERLQAAISEAYAFAGKIEKALIVADSIAIRKWKRLAYYAISWTLLKAEKYDLALKVINLSKRFRLKGGESVSYELGLLSRVYAKMGKLGEALDSANSIKNDRIRINCLGDIAQEFKDIGDKTKAVHIVSQCLQLARKAKDSASRNDLLGKVATLYARLREYKPCREVVQLMDENEWDWKAAPLHDIANQCIQNKDYKKAYEFATANKDKSYKSKDLNSIGLEYVKGGDRAKGFDLICEGLECANSIADSEVKGRVVQEIVESLVEIKGYDRALEIADSIKAARRKHQALSYIAAYLAKGGKVRDAREAAKNIKDESYKFYPLIALGDAAKSNGRKGKALRIYSNALKIAKSSNTEHRNQYITAVAVRYAEMGQYCKAFELVESFDKYLSKVKALRSISRAYFKADVKARREIRVYLHKIIKDIRNKRSH